MLKNAISLPFGYENRYTSVSGPDSLTGTGGCLLDSVSGERCGRERPVQIGSFYCYSHIDPIGISASEVYLAESLRLHRQNAALASAKRGGFVCRTCQATRQYCCKLLSRDIKLEHGSSVIISMK